MSINLINSFAEFKEMKNIDRPTMTRMVENVFRTLIRKKYGSDENFDVIVNPDKGDLEILRRREIVADDEVTDERRQVGVTYALNIDKDVEIGDDLYEPLSIEDFGRRSVLTARQTLMTSIMEVEKDELYRQYNKRVGELVVGEVSQTLKRELVVIDEATDKELVLPREEMIRGDYYRKGDTIRAIIKRVDMRNGNTPLVILSRTDEQFLEKLMAQEVPEIEEEIIIVRKIVRQPGDRAKIAVESTDDRIDPVGVKGSRIHGIVRELRNENIDIIPYTTNMALYMQRALVPAKLSSIELDHENRRASIYLKPEEVSKAIGKNGVNIKLASRLTGYEIDVYRDSEYAGADNQDDIDLDEFNDEIEQWVINELKRIGYDTARSVLNVSVEELSHRADLEEETIEEVVRILKQEFPDEY
jgi:N utilization substance protein A